MMELKLIFPRPGSIFSSLPVAGSSAASRPPHKVTVSSEVVDPYRLRVGKAGEGDSYLFYTTTAQDRERTEQEVG